MGKFSFDIKHDNISNIKLKQIINIELLQKFQDSFAQSMNIASITVDINGNPVTKPSSYTSFCNDYTHSTEIGDNRCAMSHKRGGEEAARIGKPYIYTCHAGLIDFAAPIIIEGVLIGTILGGQILIEKPNIPIFRNTAKEIGVDEEKYIEAVNKVQLSSYKKVQAAADILYIVANSLSKIGFENLKIKKMSSDIVEGFEQIAVTMKDLAATSENMNTSPAIIEKELFNVKQISSLVNVMLDSITSIADQTKMLGLNAAIEVAKVEDASKDFGMVASDLSQNSIKAISEIAGLSSDIHKALQKTGK